MDISFDIPPDGLSPPTRELLRAAAAPVCSLDDAEGLETVCTLGYWLYIDRRREQVLRLLEPFSGRSFDGSFDTFTWVRAGLALRSRVGDELGREPTAEAFRRTVLEAMEAGDDGRVRVRRKVHARFLAGDQITFDKVQAAIDGGDPESELGWRVVALMNQVILEQFGGSEQVPRSRLTGEIEANLEAIRRLAAVA